MHCRVRLHTSTIYTVQKKLAQCVEEGSLTLCTSIVFCLTQQLHLCACSSHLTVSAMVPLQASARAAERGAVLHVLWLRQALLQSQLQLWSVSRRSWSWRVQGRRRRQRQGAWQPSWRACAVRDQQSHPGYVTHTIRLVKKSRLRPPFAHVSQLTCGRELSSLHKTGPANTDRCLTILPPSTIPAPILAR